MGTKIGNDAIIGQHCVTATSMLGSTSYLGNPAMAGRRGLTWDRTSAGTLDEAETIHPSRVRQANHVKTCAEIDNLADRPPTGLPEIHALSRILAADFPIKIAERSEPLCVEAQRLRIWATEQAQKDVNLSRSP